MSDGKGCKCGAYGSCECGCPDVDWTPQEVYDLKATILRLEKKLSIYQEQEKRWLSQMVVGDYDACNTLCDALEMQGRDIQAFKAEVNDLKQRLISKDEDCKLWRERAEKAEAENELSK